MELQTTITASSTPLLIFPLMVASCHKIRYIASMSQNTRLLEYLKRSDVTQLQAFSELGICRLSERVRELERQGHVIEHKMVEVPTREGTARVTRYRLIQ